MRFTEEGFLNDRNTSDIALIGKMGMVMKTESGESTIKKLPAVFAGILLAHIDGAVCHYRDLNWIRTELESKLFGGLKRRLYHCQICQFSGH